MSHITCHSEIGGVSLLNGGRDAAVVRLTVAVPGAVTELGVTVHDPFGMLAVQLSATVPVKPPSAPTVTGTLPCIPRVTALVVAAVMLKSQPVPVSATVCGLLAALSVMVSVPERGLFVVADGVNVTLIEQVALTVTVELLHVSVSAKSFETPMAPAPNTRLAVPVFLIVTV